ncbi:hypothetical protein J6590_090127 [Homalodisca vitripennis]|nr:hypothetical protein J6590_090127 [Homalodisca vitripennis]
MSCRMLMGQGLETRSSPCLSGEAAIIVRLEQPEVKLSIEVANNLGKPEKQDQELIPYEGGQAKMLEKIQNVLETDQWTVFGEKSSTIDDFVVLNFDEDSLKKLKALAMCSFFGRERIIFKCVF